MDLTGKAVVVAGASGVLGGLIANRLYEKGALLVLAGRDEGRLAETAAGLPLATSVRFDIRSPASAASPIETAIREYGRLDGVVNAAGVVSFGSLASHTEEVIDDVISTNLLGPLHLMAAAARHMQGGFIVNITGVVAEQPFPGMSVYVAAKTGLSAATRALARELRREGVLVVDARPPHTETGLTDRAIHGEAPGFPEGLQPERVAARIVGAIEADMRQVPSEDFTPEDGR